MLSLLALLQKAPPPAPGGWWDRFADFVDTPLPYSPFSEYLVVLFFLWALARYDHARMERKKSLDRQAQEVLDAKFEQGEISREVFEKYRQDVSRRP